MVEIERVGEGLDEGKLEFEASVGMVERFGRWLW